MIKRYNWPLNQHLLKALKQCVEYITPPSINKMSYLKMDLKNKDKKYYLGIIGINIGIMMIIFIFILNEM